MKNKGFTLIEIIIALFIFSIIAIIISYGLHNVFNAKQKITYHEKRLNQLQFALTLIQHDTTQLIDYSNTKNGNATSTNGNNKQFTFFTTSNANPLGLEKRSDLMQVRYAVQNGKLVRHIWLGLNMHPIAITRTLLPKVTNFKFRYLSKTGFIDVWPSPDQLNTTPPKAIQITFNIPNWGQVSQLYRIRGTTIATG